MARRRGRPRQSSLDQIVADAVTRVLDERDKSQKPQSPTAGARAASAVVDAYVAEPPAKIDGQITLADGLVAVVIGGTGLFCGTLGALAHLLIYQELDAAAEFAGYLTGAGALVGFGRLVLDALNPLALFTEWVEYRQAVDSGDWDAFLDWQQERRWGERPEAVRRIEVEVRDGRRLGLLGFEGEQAERVVLFARQFVELEPGEDYPTAEAHYIPSIWSNGKAGRAAWDDFKTTLIDRGLAYKEPSGRWHLKRAGALLMRQVAKIEFDND